ncbi:hypothetical protein DL93DRAFT_501420 [Clavulina sp. PMI_390]|nr:hypothetical protein DL93DRAFT_501420 [Clavulina sp. PMI_390]
MMSHSLIRGIQIYNTLTTSFHVQLSPDDTPWFNLFSFAYNRHPTPHILRLVRLQLCAQCRFFHSILVTWCALACIYCNLSCPLFCCLYHLYLPVYTVLYWNGTFLIKTLQVNPL